MLSEMEASASGPSNSTPIPGPSTSASIPGSSTSTSAPPTTVNNIQGSSTLNQVFGNIGKLSTLSSSSAPTNNKRKNEMNPELKKTLCKDTELQHRFQCYIQQRTRHFRMEEADNSCHQLSKQAPDQERQNQQSAVGYMFVVFEVDGTYCIDHIGDLIMPSGVDDLANFKDMLESICSFKRHHVGLAKNIAPALKKLDAGKLLS
ncbi:hypothetical protein MBANPS3_000985 [Mucor bainieri]